MTTELSTEERISIAADAMVEAIKMSHRLQEANIYVPTLQQCYTGIVKVLPEVVELISPYDDLGFADKIDEATKHLIAEHEDEARQALRQSREDGTGNYL